MKLTTPPPARWPRGITLTAVASAAPVLLWLVLAATPAVTFGSSVAAAIGWCLWLERHPPAHAVHQPGNRT